MTKSALILGAQGRMGRAAVEAFVDAGWTVTGFVRPGRKGDSPIAWFEGDAFEPDVVTHTAAGHDVIVHALNPPYHRWKTDLPPLTDRVLSAARSSGATVIVPGNVYNYGADMPAVLTEETPHRPTTRKGRLREEMEARFAAAANDGVQTIILRAGDFIERQKTGNWFDSHVTAKVAQGVINYPGPTNIPHAWAYLPDLARAMVALAERRENLAGFTRFGFGGHTFSGEELRSWASTLWQHPVRLKPFPWTLLRVMAIFSPLLREVVEMRYLWDVPHQIDGGRFERFAPEFRMTPLAEVLRDVWGLQEVGLASKPPSPNGPTPIMP